jgi:hypothetical protein
MTLNVLPEFESDALEIEDRLEREHSGYGDDFRDLLDLIIEKVVENPFRFGRVDDGPNDVEAREGYIHRFEYRVIYVLHAESIYMLSPLSMLDDVLVVGQIA